MKLSQYSRRKRQIQLRKNAYQQKTPAYSAFALPCLQLQSDVFLNSAMNGKEMKLPLNDFIFGRHFGKRDTGVTIKN